MLSLKERFRKWYIVSKYHELFRKEVNEHEIRYKKIIGWL
jgi:hypothetical protein